MGCLKAKIVLTGDRLNVNIGVVCMPNTDVYLRVTPDKVVIPADDTTAQLYVASNTDYKIRRTPIAAAYLRDVPTVVEIP